MNLKCLDNTSCRCTAQLHLLSEPTTPTLCTACAARPHNTNTHCPTSLCCGLRFVYNGLQSFDITRRVSCSYKSIVVWLWRAKIYSFPIIILCHGSTRLVHHWCAPSERLIFKAAVWIADLSLIKILFNSFWLQIKLGFWTISEMPPPHNCRFIACIYVKQRSQCLQL